MPRAKRAQVVTLSKTRSKGKEGKSRMIAGVQEAANKYEYVWVFSVKHMRNNYLKQVRKDFETSRFFFGSNKVMAKALGNAPEEEIRSGIHQVSESLVGDVGLFFTNEDIDQVKQQIHAISEQDYARAGTVATYRVVVSEGEVKRGYSQEVFPNNMEPQLRELGMPTRLKQGKITINEEYVICEKGDRLTPQQAQLLKHFWEKMATFQIKLLSYWQSSTGEFVQLEAATSASSDNEDECME